MARSKNIIPIYEEPLRTIPHNIFRDNNPEYDELEQRPRMPVVALLDNIRSMFNVGSMFRTADGAFDDQVVGKAVLVVKLGDLLSRGVL